MKGFRKLLLNIHLWVGLAACLLLAMLGITGAVLVFEYRIDHLLHPSLSYVTPQGERKPLAELAQAVKQQYPQARIVGMDLSASSPSPDLAYSFNVLQGKERWQVYVNQYTGSVLGARQPQKEILTTIHQLHINLLGGPAWKIVTTWGSVLCCLLAVSGIYLWWPRKIFGAKFNSSARRINFDLHNSVGLYASFFVFIFAFTAVVMHWEDEFFPVANAITRSPSDMPDPKLSSTPAPPGTKPVGLDEVYAAAAAQMPGARVTQIGLPGKPTDIIRVWLKYPEDGTPSGRSWVFLDQSSGKVLWARNSRTAPVGTRYMKMWNREIHTGDIFGWWSKIVALLASLSVAFLSVSGPLIWFLNQKTKKVAAAARRVPERKEQLA